MSPDAIATSAGVGAGTLYRHFPSRSDLWGVVLVDPLREQLRLVEEALRDEDKWAGLSGYIMASCALEADSRGYLNLMMNRTRRDPTHWWRSAGGFRHSSKNSFARRVRRARFVQISPPKDLTSSIMLANSRIAEATRDAAPVPWRRNVEPSSTASGQTGRHPSPNRR